MTTKPLQRVPNTASINGVRSRFRKYVATLLVSFSVYATPSSAHEYWLSPMSYNVDVGKKVLINIRNGEDFAGSTFPYQPSLLKELTISGNGETVPVESRLGDLPAVHPNIDKPGLYSVLLTSTERTLIYDEWDRFTDFLTYHGLTEFEKVHQSKRFPTNEVKEHYFRFAKTFVQVAKNASDETPLTAEDVELLSTAQGQELEIVITNNPYGDSREIEIALLYQGKPLANRQVELFTKSDAIDRVITRTDTQGRALFENVQAGEHMLNAVQMVDGERRGAHWKTLWASVTLLTKK